MSKYDLLALPVVDETGTLLGIVTVDDALDVLEEESAEDLALATGSERDRGPVATLWSRIWRRSIWVGIWGAAIVGAAVWSQRASTRAEQNGGPLWVAIAISFVPLAALLLPLVAAHRRGGIVSARSPRSSRSDDEERPLAWRRRVVGEGAVGLVLGLRRRPVRVRHQPGHLRRLAARRSSRCGLVDGAAPCWSPSCSAACSSTGLAARRRIEAEHSRRRRRSRSSR